MQARPAPRRLAAITITVWAAIWAGVWATVSALACASESQVPVVLVTLDTARHDRFGFAGDPEARTPVVDALAGRGTVFERAFASTPLTLPSHTTIMTGIDPRGHGVHDNGRFRVPDDLTTLAEHLRGAGYETAAFVGSFVLDPRFNLDQGFDVYRAETHPERDPLSFQVPERQAREVTDDALAWLDTRSPDRPFFLWVHYYDPHQPLVAPPPFDAMSDPYAAEIAYADAQLGRLLGAVDAATDGRALVIFTSDHGESVGEHGEATHGLLAYDATLWVPLVIAGPGVATARSPLFARHIDLSPTVLAAVGLAVPPEMSGRDLLSARDDEGIFGYFESRGPSESLGWAPVEGARTHRWKFTAMPDPPELYDLIDDPREQRNVARSQPEALAELQEIHARLVQGQRQSTGQARAVSPDERKRLAALGYLDAPQRYEPGAEPDPRSYATVHAWVERARALAVLGHFAESVEALEVLAQSEPVRALALRSLAPVYAQLGRGEDAIRAYRGYVELTGSVEGRMTLAAALLSLGRAEETLEALAPAPSEVGSLLLGARALARLGRIGEAHAAIDAALPGPEHRVDRLRERAILLIDAAPLEQGDAPLRALLAQAPDDPVLQSQLGYYLAVFTDRLAREEALDLLRTAAQRAPDDPELLARLGWGAYNQGLAREAVEALEAALALDWARFADRARLGFALLAVGETERAHRELSHAIAAHPGAKWVPRAKEVLGMGSTGS